MAKTRFGTQGQVSFRDLNEYYYVLGFLANSNNAELRWENNEDQGAWGSEGRIHCLIPEERFPQCFRFTAGRGNIHARINCNEYVATLVTEHNFKTGSCNQDLSAILETVPEKYRDAFKEGYGAKITVNPAYKEKKSTAVRKSEAQIVVEKKSEPPAPQPIEISKGDTLKHKSFGLGKVINSDGHYITIVFDSVGEKTFVNPDAFIKGFLAKA